MVCCLAIAFVGVWFGFSCFEQESLESDLTMANTKGHTYNVGWARYSCQVARGEYCNKQGIYSGGVKLD